jgi:hypothetical protein
MTKKQKIDLFALALKMYVGLQITSILIMEVAGAFRVKFSEAIFASAIFTSIAVFLMYIPAIISTSKTRRNEPFRFSRIVKAYVKVPIEDNFPYFDQSKLETAFKIAGTENKYIDESKRFERFIFMRDYSAFEGFKVVEITVTPDTRTLQYGGDRSFTALSSFLTESGLANSNVPLDEDGRPCLSSISTQ